MVDGALTTLLSQTFVIEAHAIAIIMSAKITKLVALTCIYTLAAGFSVAIYSTNSDLLLIFGQIWIQRDFPFLNTPLLISCGFPPEISVSSSWTDRDIPSLA